MAGLILKNINKTYDQKLQVIKNLNLDVYDGEFLVLVGPSGCGKSTVLRMIAGLEDITGGEIFIDDKKINNVHPKDRDIAMVFQNYALYPHMTVYENMAFGLKMRKFKKDFIDARVKKAAETLDLTELLARKPKQLSGGQRQRVALGRAIVREPKVFLMDEPLSNLDAKLRAQTRFEIKKLHKSLKTTFIYVTHDQVEAMTMGDRIVILDKGVIQQIGTPEEVYFSPENVFVGGFIGSPAMNFLEAEITEDKKIKIGSIFLEPEEKNAKLIEQNSLAGKKAILGIRPEHFLINQNNVNAFKIIPDFIETLGSEKLIHFTVNDKKVIAKTSVETEIMPDNTTVSADASKILLFDINGKKRFILSPSQN
ncbi:MAG TPA: sn-glycerol-3-phosphate ABC transporter ATP-binding protein UgpC [Candidatus Gastranaerophilales bacterium]|nr:sn-glycerol-3-phosphate ABC transporter ATP-binding protein UgpC [Candidatus Gastranaerophilales bacterium]